MAETLGKSHGHSNLGDDSQYCPDMYPSQAASHRKRCWRRLYDFFMHGAGNSQHSILRKTRFALIYFSFAIVFSVSSVAKDIYLEKFGLDATVLGVLVVIMAFIMPVMDLFMGQLQDTQVLARCFPPSTWGRRAPWLLTHSILGAVAASVIYLPPGGIAAYVWFAAIKLLTMWGGSGVFISFETARQEIYPSAAERIVVEGLCKYTAMAGAGAGSVVGGLLLTTSTSFQVRLLLTPYTLILGLVGLFAVPVVKEARSYLSTDSCHDAPSPVSLASHPLTGFARIKGTLGVVWEALPLFYRRTLRRCRRCEVAEPKEKPANKALQHMLAVKFWTGAYFASIGTLILYYVTYVLRLGKWERAQFILITAFAAGFTEVVMSVIIMRIFGRIDEQTDSLGRADRRLMILATCLRIVHAGITILVVGLLPPSIPLIIVWSVMARICLSCFSFWRVSAQCYLVDEDCYGTRGCSSYNETFRKMREGMIFSALSMCQSFAGALTFSLAFLGLGLAGLQTRNCESVCQALAEDILRRGGSFDHSSCEESCFYDVIRSQPDSLRMYVRVVIGFWAPICELFIAYHTFSFPIKGQRLQELHAAVAAGRELSRLEGQLQVSIGETDEHGRFGKSVTVSGDHRVDDSDFTGAVPEAEVSANKVDRRIPASRSGRGCAGRLLTWLTL